MFCSQMTSDKPASEVMAEAVLTQQAAAEDSNHSNNWSRPQLQEQKVIATHWPQLECY